MIDFSNTLEFIIFLGVIHFLINLCWKIIGALIIFPLSFINKNLAFLTQRFCGIILMSICIVYLAILFSNNNFDFFLYVFLGFLVTFNSLMIASESMVDSFDWTRNLTLKQMEINRKYHQLDTNFSYSFCIGTFIILSIFSDFTANTITYTIYNVIESIIEIEGLGFIIRLVGGFFGIYYILNSIKLLFIRFLYFFMEK